MKKWTKISATVGQHFNKGNPMMRGKIQFIYSPLYGEWRQGLKTKGKIVVTTLFIKELQNVIFRPWCKCSNLEFIAITLAYSEFSQGPLNSQPWMEEQFKRSFWPHWTRSCWKILCNESHCHHLSNG